MTSALLIGLILAAPSPLKVKVDGDGYLRFVRDGRIVYAKETQLQVARGVLVGTQGVALLPQISVPSNVADLSVSLDGFISGKSGAKVIDLGRLVIALFKPGTALSPKEGYLIATDRANLTNPGEGLAGVIRSEFGGAPSEQPTTPAASTKPHTGKPEIKIRALSEVAGPTVTLGEVAEISASEEDRTKLEAIVLGDAPVAGIPRPLVQSRLLFLIQQAGFKSKDIEISIPLEAKIALKIQKVTATQFISAAKDAVAQQLGVNLPLTCSQSISDFNAPVGELKLEAGQATKNQAGFTVLVSILVDGRRLNSRLVALNLDSASIVAIKSGDPVRIHLKSAGASIEVTGKARTSGFLGQQITVVSSTGSVHLATVVSAGEVEVKL